MRTPYGAGGPAVQEQVAAHNRAFVHFGTFSDKIHKRPLSTEIAQNRQHIFLWIIGMATVRIAVHVNCQTRNHDKVAVDIDKPADKLVSFPQDKLARNRQRPVKPRRTQHTAIFFDVQPDICVFNPHLWVFFDFKTGRITV